MPGLGIALRASASRETGEGRASPPTPAITNIVINGDSQTSNTPQMTGGNRFDYWSYQYKDYRPALNVTVTAQGSRVVGGSYVPGPPPEAESPGPNSLLATRDADMALNPQLIAAMIGSNDLTVTSVSTVIARIAAWAAPIRAAGVKVVLVTPPRFDSRDPRAATFNARHAEYLPAIRAQWPSMVDALVDFAEHPDVDVTADPHPLIGDGVHLTPFDNLTPDNGQNVLHDVMAAVLDSATDPARTGATSPYPGNWFGADVSVLPSEVVEQRWIVSGLGLGVVATAGVSGTGAALRRGSGVFGTANLSVKNGDVLTLRVTAASANSTARAATVTIGAATDTLTLTTAAATAQPVAYNHGDVIGQVTPGDTITYPACTFGTGLAVLAIDSSAPSTSVTVGGTAATKVRRDDRLEVWTAPVTAGNRDVVIQREGGYVARHVLSHGTAVNTGGVIDHKGATPGYESEPFLVPAMTVPANGLMLGFFDANTGLPYPTTGAAAPSIFVDAGHVELHGEANGIGVAKRTTSGQIGFTFGFGFHQRSGIVLGPTA